MSQRWVLVCVKNVTITATTGHTRRPARRWTQATARINSHIFRLRISFRSHHHIKVTSADESECI